MNKVIIKEIGYDFNDYNVEDYKKSSPKERLKKIYILANYSQLEGMRKKLVDQVAGICTDNIITFDDLIEKYKKQSKYYINREEAAWILKKIIEDEDINEYSNSIGSLREVIKYLFNVKSFFISADDYISKAGTDKELLFIGKLFKKYEEVLLENNIDDEIGKSRDAIENIKAKKNPKNYQIVINGFIDFRNNELLLIESMIKSGFNILIEYPFYTNRENKIFDTTISSLKNIGFNIELKKDGILDKLELNILAQNSNKFNKKISLVAATSKFYEIRDIFALINKKLDNNKLDDFSFIITEDYENIIKLVAPEFNLPVNIMNEEKARDLPYIKKLLSFLKFTKFDEKKRLISLIANENFNLFVELDKGDFIRELIELDYVGINGNYSSFSDNFQTIILAIRNLLEEFRSDSLGFIEKYFTSENAKKQELLSFKLYKEEKVLSESFKAIEIIDKISKSIKTFGQIIKIDGKNLVEMFIDKLEEEKYYSSSNQFGIKVFKGINSIGISSPIKIICGLDQKFPQIKSMGYFYSNKYSAFHKKIGFSFANPQDDFDNKLILFSQGIAGAKELILSYSCVDGKLEAGRSLFLNDLLARIYKTDTDYGTFFAESQNKYYDLTTRFIRDTDNLVTELNYLSKEKINNINNLRRKYTLRRNLEKLYLGKIHNFPDDFQSIYSPKSLEYYNECPFKYYIKYILNYKNLELEYKDEFNLEKGRFYHKILEWFFKLPDYVFLDDYEIESIIYIMINNYEKLYSLSFKDYQKEIYKNYLAEYIKIDIKNQKNFNGDFKPTKFEEKIEKSIRNLKIFGRVDRLDLNNENNVIIYDYKSKTIPTKSEILNFKALQLPIYGLLLGEEKVVGLVYSAIEKASLGNYLFNKNIYSRGQDANEIDQYFNDLVLLIENIDQNIKSGNFVLDSSNEVICKNCEYNIICRKEEVGINGI